MNKTIRSFFLGLSFIALAQLMGCAAAAVGGAAAGAAGAVAYSDRGAKGDVKGDPEAVRQRAQSVFNEMGIEMTGTSVKNSGKEEQLTGKAGDKDVTIQINDAGNSTTHVEVIAREGAVKWNKDYAKSVLSRIIQQS